MLVALGSRRREELRRFGSSLPFDVANAGLARGLWTSKKELARLAEPYLEDGEAIRHILVAHQSILEPHWAIIVTDRAILMVEPGAVRPATTGRIRGREARRLPRATRLGPVHGEGWIVVDGERFFVAGQKRTIAAIDADAGFPPATA